MRLLRTADDAAASIAALGAGEVPPGVVGATLEAASACDAGNRGEPSITDGEGAEITVNSHGFEELHAMSVGPPATTVGAERKPILLRSGCRFNVSASGAHVDTLLRAVHGSTQDQAELVPFDQEGVMPLV